MRMLGDFCHMAADRPPILFSVKWNNKDSIDCTALWGCNDLQHWNSHAQYMTSSLCVLILCQQVRGWVNSELIRLWLIESVLPLTSCVNQAELKCFYRSRFSLCKINAITLSYFYSPHKDWTTWFYEVFNNHINIKNLWITVTSIASITNSKLIFCQPGLWDIMVDSHLKLPNTAAHKITAEEYEQQLPFESRERSRPSSM